MKIKKNIQGYLLKEYIGNSLRQEIIIGITRLSDKTGIGLEGFTVYVFLNIYDISIILYAYTIHRQKHLSLYVHKDDTQTICLYSHRKYIL